MDIPLIDISGFSSDDPQARDEVVKRWREALDRLGFLTISGHGVPHSLISAVHSAGSAFFRLPQDRKRVWAVRDLGGGPSGYVQLFGETVGRTHDGSAVPDVAESLSFVSPAAGIVPAAGPVAHQNLWPDEPDGFRELIGEYAAQAYDLGLRLMRISALALGLAENHFDTFYSPMGHKLRLAYYPEQAVEPEPGQLRNAAHTDFSGFTILRQDDAPGGLQVQAPSGEWIDVPSRPGTLVINTGDLIQRWTNDRWLSNIHRVVNPPRAHHGPTQRLSLVFFTGPSPDSEIKCLPTCEGPDQPPVYEPIIASDHLNLKLAQTYGSAEAGA